MLPCCMPAWQHTINKVAVKHQAHHFQDNCQHVSLVQLQLQQHSLTPAAKSGHAQHDH